MRSLKEHKIETILFLLKLDNAGTYHQMEKKTMI